MTLPGIEPSPPTLSTGAPGPAEFRLAQGIGILSLVALVILGPYATRPLSHFAAFTPAYDAWVVLCALITTLLLMGQVAIVRSEAIVVLSIGYLVAALTNMLLLFSFPGNLSAGGLFGAASVLPDVLALISGLILPVSVIIYVLMRGIGAEDIVEEPPERRSKPQRTPAIMGAVAVVVLGWGALPVIVLGARALGPLMSGAAGYAALFKGLDQFSVILGILAMAALVARRFRTRFDLWLFVTLLAGFCGVVLTGLLSKGSDDLGWYGGHAFGAAASSSLLVALLFESANHFRQLAQVHDALLVSNRSLEHLSLHDSLTGLANRRYFDTYLARQASLMRRHGRDLALVLCDMDNFKAFNDHYGHQAGDECLASIAAALRTCCRRPTDLAARYGGEEFALILPETDLAGAARIAEAARAAVARLNISNARSASGPTMTLSGGVSVLGAGAGGTLSDLIAAADSALFEAKRQGRDRIISTKSTASPPETQGHNQAA